MPTCHACGEELERLPHTCNFCEHQFCDEHRLPEKHLCRAKLLGESSGSGSDGWFSGKYKRSNVRADTSNSGSSDDTPMETDGGGTVDRGGDDRVGHSGPETAPDGSLVYPDEDEPAREPDPPTSETSSSRSRVFVVLGLVALIAVSVAAGAVVFGDADLGTPGAANVSDSGEDTGPQQNGGETVFEDGFIGGSDAIEEMRVFENGTLRLSFKDDHDSDGFVILHDYHSDPSEHSIVMGESPEFGGTVDITFRDELGAAEYPNPSFTLEIRDGSFCAWDEPCITLYGEQHESIGFDVPDSWIDGSAETGDADGDSGNTISL